ncbi:MAG: acyl-CoA thioesterase [Deltaproteobacteria bacterium]|nr:acyl-CoA thioesterase [Deltaproteobacteria bacterium]
MHESRFVIRSTQVDTFGHLNNAAYLEIYEWARWEWAAEVDMDLLRLAEQQRIGPAMLHVDLSFHKELTMHEPVLVRTWVEDVQRLRGVIGQQMRKASGELASSMKLTFVMFDLTKRKAVRMPEAFERAFEADAAFRAQRGSAPEA